MATVRASSSPTPSMASRSYHGRLVSVSSCSGSICSSPCTQLQPLQSTKLKPLHRAKTQHTAEAEENPRSTSTRRRTLAAGRRHLRRRSSRFDRSMEPTKPGIRGEPAAAGRREREGGLAGVVKAMTEPPKDPCLQASVVFLSCGSAVVLYGTTGRPTNGAAANPEHILAGFAMCAVGAALAFLTLSGAGSLRRAAARLEEALSGYFSS
ncbi:hypothetical protein HU200_059178 [Digitaria exilis]|uniref:Uncharacterized protein n=1 Tax=Digitaria exilis TaxID=1010633 RepID=A0A835A8P6_9POAL|nr:hypothetical protein HU200_059178 [Digitaria exilis]